jgi:hypothetical protein
VISAALAGQGKQTAVASTVSPHKIDRLALAQTGVEIGVKVLSLGLDAT